MLAGSGQRAMTSAIPPSVPPHWCQWSRSRPSSSTSATSMRTSSRVSPRNGTPSRRRTVLPPPSAPTTKRARRVPTVVARLAPSSVAVRSSTRTPCSTATPSSASRSRSTCSTRHCGISRVDGQGVSLVAGWSPRATSSKPPSRRWRRIGSVVRPRDTSRSVTPAASSSSSERGCSPLPREPGNGAGAASSTRTATPRRASSRAAVSPVGPAPTTITSASMDATLRRSETESQLVLGLSWVAVSRCPV